MIGIVSFRCGAAVEYARCRVSEHTSNDAARQCKEDPPYPPHRKTETQHHADTHAGEETDRRPPVVGPRRIADAGSRVGVVVGHTTSYFGAMVSVSENREKLFVGYRPATPDFPSD